MAVTPKCKEFAFWKGKEKEGFGGFGHEFFYHHTLFGGYTVTNAVYTTMKAVKGSGACLQKNFANVFPTTLENAPSQASWTAYSDVTRTIWLEL